MRLLGIGARATNFRTRIADKFVLPERFKGTVVEKWAKYWKGLFSDYGEVATGLIKDARTNPKGAAVKCGVAYGLYACYKRNPDMEVLTQSLRQWNNEMILVSPETQNRISAEYLRRLERDMNHKTIRMLSLGLFTIVWEDLYDADDCTYPAICDYTSVGYFNFHERVIDVGFWNRFWRLDWAMRNFDINYL